MNHEQRILRWLQNEWRALMFNGCSDGGSYLVSKTHLQVYTICSSMSVATAMGAMYTTLQQ